MTALRAKDINKETTPEEFAAEHRVSLETAQEILEWARNPLTSPDTFVLVKEDK
jgi:hypothetical protein